MPKKKEVKDESKLNHKTFWAVLISILIVSIISIISYIETPSLTGNVAVQTISFVKGGNDFSFEVRDVKGIGDISLTLAKDVKNGVVRLDEIESPKFEGKVYSAFVVSSTDEEKFEKIAFTIKILESDLQKLGIEIGELTLYHEDRSLLTISGLREKGYVWFTATSSGMGEFVIGKREFIEVEEIVETVEEDEPVIPVEASTPKKSFWQKFVDFFRNLF